MNDTIGTTICGDLYRAIQMARQASRRAGSLSEKLPFHLAQHELEHAREVVRRLVPLMDSAEKIYDPEWEGDK